MALITSQKITLYYERFKSIDVTFTKEIIQVTGLLTQHVHLKCVSDFWPCVVYSSSFEGAKVVANIKSGLIAKLQQANNLVSLRLSFKSVDTGNPVTFFVSSKSVNHASYGGSADVALFTLQFTQRPPDDLIEIMGRLLDANVNSAKRREERIFITPDTQRKLKLLSKESAVFIQGVPRRCILRDISFSGAKLIMMGVAKFLVDKEAALRLDFDDPRESFLLRGKFVRAEAVEGRSDLLALAILYDEAAVPMGYKIRFNDFIGTVRADSRQGSAETESKGANSAASRRVPSAAHVPGVSLPSEKARAAPAEAPPASVEAPQSAPDPGDEIPDLVVPKK
ncbi:MAG: PilZ domain-containing protein [Treponema sp.]|nr:PilZ domain-containing protein [Treponema sp.]